MSELHRVEKLARKPFSFETEIVSGLSMTYELQLELWKGLSFEGWGTDVYPFLRRETQKLLVLIAISCQPRDEPHEANAEEVTHQTDKKEPGVSDASRSHHPEV